MRLMLGFEDIPYSSARARERLTARKRRGIVASGYGEGKTSGEVAEDLEDRYRIVDAFYTLEEDFIIDLIEEQAAMDLEEVMTMGTPSDKGMSFKETDKIEKKFVDNIRKRAYDGRLPGTVPTKAAVREGRPSFYKTGLYARSFRAWMEE